MGKFYWIGFFVGLIGAFIINVTVVDTGIWGLDFLLMFIISFSLTFALSMLGKELDTRSRYKRRRY